MKVEHINSIGLILDILGFVLISKDLIKPKSPTDEEVLEVHDLSGNPIGKPILTNQFFIPSIYAKIGFYLIILGFLFQLGGNIVSMNLGSDLKMN